MFRYNFNKYTLSINPRVVTLKTVCRSISHITKVACILIRRHLSQNWPRIGLLSIYLLLATFAY
jgi:hypothetical protein